MAIAVVLIAIGLSFLDSLPFYAALVCHDSVAIPPITTRTQLPTEQLGSA